MPTPHHIVSRFLTSKAIGNLTELLRNFEDAIQVFEQGVARVQTAQDFVVGTIERQEAVLAREYERMVADSWARHRKQPVSDGGPNLFEEIDEKWTQGAPKSLRDSALFAKALRIKGFEKMQGHGRQLFLAVLQQLSLPPAQGRKVQAASRYWAKSKLVDRREPRAWAEHLGYVKEPALFLAEIGVWREQLALAKDCLSKGVDHATAQDTRIKAGPFTLINTGNFKPAVMETVKDIIEKATRYLTGVGLGKICYGDIHVTKTISSGNVLAFYMIEHDEMFVRANVRLNDETVRTVCHELAHRLHKKFLGSKDRDIDQLYQNLKYSGANAARETLGWPKAGQEVIVKGNACVVKYVSPLENAIKLVEKPDPLDPGKKLNSYTANIEWWAINIEGKTPERTPNYKSFITSYAKTSPTENFAEMVSFYAMGKLPKALEDLLQPILG